MRKDGRLQTLGAMALVLSTLAACSNEPTMVNTPPPPPDVAVVTVTPRQAVDMDTEATPTQTQ